MICVPIVEETVGDMIRAANSADADMVELRIDYLKDTTNIASLARIEKKKIVTCMPRWEGGKFKGSEDERISLLEKAMDFADFITVELKTNPNDRNRVIKKAKKRGLKVIVAYHDLQTTPKNKEILKIIREEEKAGADIAKVAFMPKSYDDVMTLLNVLREKKTEIPVIALSMGELGKVSRILAPLMGSYLTFASLDKGKESASGQLTVDEVKRAMELLK